MNHDEIIEFAKRIRDFELKVLQDFKKSIIRGTVHCCIGQEYDIVKIISQLKEIDSITSNHRGHGHFLAYTKNFEGLYNELCGFKSGINGGKGLSQHLHQGNFYCTGIQGGFTPVACGIALAEKMNSTKNIVVSFIGDGTLGQGVLYESLNIASLMQLPICFVLENNHYAMSTPTKKAVAGSIEKRFESFGLQKGNIDDIREILPSYIIIDTYRFCGHSGNDNKCYRSKEEELEWIKKDKLNGYGLI